MTEAAPASSTEESSTEESSVGGSGAGDGGTDDEITTRFAACYDGPWAPADALVWAAHPARRTASGLEPPGERLAELRRRVYREGASAADAAVFAAASADLDRLQQQARLAAYRAGVPLREAADGAADTSPADADEAVDDPRTQPPIVAAPSASPPRITRRRVVQAAGLAVVAAGGATAAVLLNRPPDLGPLTRRSVGWSVLPGGRPASGAVIDAPDLTSRSAAVAFLSVPSTSVERHMAPRSPFFARGSGGSTDFDVHAFDVGVANVAITVACDAATRLTIELGVLAGVHHPVPQTALRVVGQVPADQWQMAVCPLLPFERPHVLRVATAPGAHYLLRAVFVGSPGSSLF